MRERKIPISTVLIIIVGVEAPIVSLIDGFMLICIFISAFTTFLIMTKRLKLNAAKKPITSVYYISDIAHYISESGKSYPMKSLLFLIDNLAETGIIKRQTAIKTKLYVYFNSIFPVPRRYKRSSIYKIIDKTRGDSIIG